MTRLLEDHFERHTTGSDVIVFAAWSPGQVWTAGAYIAPTICNGFYYECTTAGTGGVNWVDEPTWPTTFGATVVDNEAVWVCRGSDPGWDAFAVSGVATGAIVSSPIICGLKSFSIDATNNGVVGAWVYYNGRGTLNASIIYVYSKGRFLTMTGLGGGSIFLLRNSAGGGYIALLELLNVGEIMCYNVYWKNSAAAKQTLTGTPPTAKGIDVTFEIEVEWRRASVADNDGVIRFWLDRQLIAEKTNCNNFSVPVLNEIRVQANSAAGSTQKTLYDNIIIDSAEQIALPVRTRKCSRRGIRKAQRLIF